MKKSIIAFSFLVSQICFANESINTYQAIDSVAPGLFYKSIAIGSGTYDGLKTLPCTLMVKSNDQINLTLIVGDLYTEIKLDKQLSSYDKSEEFGEPNIMKVSLDQDKGVFSYYYDFGTNTNQITGAHTYALTIEKQSENTFVINYFHSWQDDDGMSGDQNFKCHLTLAK